MVGGRIIGYAKRPNYTLLHVQDQNDYCTVKTKEFRIDTGESIKIKVGDRVWWQQGKLFWTPKNTKIVWEKSKSGVDYDIPLIKIGYSH